MPPKRQVKNNEITDKQQVIQKIEQPVIQQQQKQQSIINQPEDIQLQQQVIDEIKQLTEQGLRKKKQVDRFKQYVEQNGIAMAFQVIFAQILDKKIQQKKLFQYTAMRLRQIGQDLQKIKMGKR